MVELSIEEANLRVNQAEEILNNILRQMGDANDQLLSMHDQQAFLGTSGSQFQVGGSDLFDSGKQVADEGNNLLVNARHAAQMIHSADGGFS